MKIMAEKEKARKGWLDVRLEKPTTGRITGRRERKKGTEKETKKFWRRKSVRYNLGI